MRESLLLTLLDIRFVDSHLSANKLYAKASELSESPKLVNTCCPSDDTACERQREESDVAID